MALHAEILPSVVVALVGPAGSGKSTVAHVLKDQYNFQAVAFAEPLKEGCKHLFNLSEAQLKNHVLKEMEDSRWNLSPRQIFQQMGDLMKKNFGDDFFIQTTISNINEYAFQNIDVVVEDCRFEKEYIMLKEKYECICVRVVRPDNPFATKHSEHCSEQEHAKFDCDIEIVNDGTTLDLQNKVSNLLLDLIHS